MILKDTANATDNPPPSYGSLDHQPGPSNRPKPLASPTSPRVITPHLPVSVPQQPALVAPLQLACPDAHHLVSSLPPGHPALLCLQTGEHVPHDKFGVALCLHQHDPVSSRMDLFSLPPLPELEDSAPPPVQQGFGHVFPVFHVPELVDKPQNPILSAIVCQQKSRPRARASIANPPVHLPQSREYTEENEHNLPKLPDSNDIWLEATTPTTCLTKVLSWDKLHPSFSPAALSTSFLSEQDPFVYAAARHLAATRLRAPHAGVLHVSNQDVLKALKMTVSGTSSTLHIWNMELETFVQRGVLPGQVGYIMIDGQDEVSSKSVVHRFLKIGTLMRRLEILVESLRSRSVHEGPTVYSFAHTLSSILAHLRNKMSGIPPIIFDNAIEPFNWMAVWQEYGIYEETLVAISALYGRSEGFTPSQYTPIDASPQSILDSIYWHLREHIDRRSPRIIIAILAYILTNVSRHYLQQISHSVAYGGDIVRKTVHVVGEKNDQYSLTELGDDEQSVDEGIIDQSTYPSFFPPELSVVLPGAQRSLSLLRAAEPNHPLLKATLHQPPITWFWTAHEVIRAWDEERPTGTSPIRPDLPSVFLPAEEDSPSYELKAGLADFQLYDMEPGSHLGGKTILKNSIVYPLEAFIETFPETLPSIAPTLSQLSSLVFDPLVHHAASLSNALLSLLLNSQGMLNAHAHISLLRSYLLLTSSSFKARLSSALFSDKFDGTKEVTAALSSHGPSSSEVAESRPWAIGLAHVLLEKETWPPVGSDLSFTLRTVIVDSFEHKIDSWSNGVSIQVLQEAEYRLGFAIRNLPTGPGRNKWLDPTCKALDFLYMDYKAPSPLDVIITPDVLSKYQRAFAFLLRLLRVEKSMHTVYRLTRELDRPLFPTLVAARKCLHHFRFVAQEFLSCVSSYIFDTAIAGNFNPFLHRLQPTSRHSKNDPPLGGFSDIFDLANCHSTLLDDILSACLLRSSQKDMGELLRSALEDVLKFAVLVGELYRGRREEYYVAEALDELYPYFFSKVSALCKLLRSSVGKNISTTFSDGVVLPTERKDEQPAAQTPIPSLSSILQQPRFGRAAIPTFHIHLPSI
ncbi:hypothetical protein AX16_002031 [Volvariella volvacea WC 439]|nr:hypothetical protein AX16_002031 [Volvariella volvacea WC 439]